jgi:GT2 family glycosyltransferase
MDSVGVCVVFYEKTDQTIACIKSVAKNPLKVYVLNNASSSGSFEKLKSGLSEFDNIVYIDSTENIGPARGRNKLINTCWESWLLFLDNDITVTTPDWHSRMIAHIEAESETEVFIPKLYNVHEQAWQYYHTYILNGKTVCGADPSDNKSNCFPGGASLVNRSLFDRLGYYDVILSVLEDFEFSIRGLMRDEPVRAKLIHDVELHHDHQQAHGSLDRNAVKTRYAPEQYLIAEQYIRDKYGIEFYSGWQLWVQQQVDKMIYYSRMEKFKKWVRKHMSASGVKLLKSILP